MIIYTIFDIFKFDHAIAYIEKNKKYLCCIKHKQQGCADCLWEFIKNKYILQKKGIRYKQNQPPIEYFRNRFFGLCWCGKPTYSKRARSCCNKHSELWFVEINAYWSVWRHTILNERSIKNKSYSKIYFCENCLYKSNQSNNFELDHIIAIKLGGMCFDRNNIQILCKKCHKNKTTQDMKIITYWEHINDNTLH